MTLGTKLMKVYFNFVYNPVYDFTTARLASYRRLQSTCIDKLKFDDGDKVLCVGVGTGNEVVHILRRNSNVDIVGVDYSGTALWKAHKKALRLGKEIRVLTMDARCLQFATGSFNKIVCLHLIDFIDDHTEVTNEILRVLKIGGQFVITYPLEKEGVSMGLNMLRDNIRHNIDSGSHRIIAVSKSLAQILVGTVYLPLFLRPKRALSRHELQTIITRLTTGDFQIEEYPPYNDFIAYGTK